MIRSFCGELKMKTLLAPFFLKKLFIRLVVVLAITAVVAAALTVTAFMQEPAQPPAIVAERVGVELKSPPLKKGDARDHDVFAQESAPSRAIGPEAITTTSYPFTSAAGGAL